MDNLRGQLIDSLLCAFISMCALCLSLIMVVVYRPIGKASSEGRLYFPALQASVLEPSSDIGKNPCHSEGSCNARASYLSGEHIDGDAIFASIGYTWKSKDLWHEDLSMQSYYRSLMTDY